MASFAHPSKGPSIARASGDSREPVTRQSIRATFATGCARAAEQTDDPVFAANGRAEILRTSFIAKYGRKALWRLKRPHRRCWPARPDPCWRWPSRLVAAAEDRLNIPAN